MHDHSTYTTTLEFTKLTAENFTARLKQGSFATQFVIFKPLTYCFKKNNRI